MKRALMLLLTLFALLAPLTAHAGHWVQDEIGWQLSSVGSPFSGTALYVRDTSFARFSGVVTSNGGTLDTTGVFSPMQAKPIAIGPGAGAASRSDSLVVGFLVFQLDTTSATAGAISSIQIAIDGRSGGFGTNVNLANWTVIDTVSAGVASGSGTVTVPVRAIGAFTGSTAQSPLAFGQLRARGVGGVGILYSARAFWRYWKED